MGLLGKWLFCVRCQYFYPNNTVLDNQQVTYLGKYRSGLFKESFLINVHLSNKLINMRYRRIKIVKYLL